MEDTRRSTVPRKLVSTFTVGAVGMAAGLLFGVAALNARERPNPDGLDLPALVAEKQETVLAAEADNQELSEQAVAFADLATTPGAAESENTLVHQAVTGPGIEVQLTDALSDLVTETPVNPNDLVVHQDDVTSVMNALWRGGAEAMGVQGVRLGAGTPVRCIGNVILVGNSVFSPPYVIEAIGDPERMAASLAADPQLEIYQQYVRVYGLGWKVEERDSITLQPVSEAQTLQYAQIS